MQLRLTIKEIEALRTISQLAHTNPFRPERLRLEAEILGEKHVPEDSLEGLSAAARAICVKTAQLLETLHTRLDSGKDLPEAHRAAYLDAVYFVVFHEAVPMIDALIDASASSEKPPTARKILSFVSECVDRFSLVRGQRIANPMPSSHLLALFYQLRRAYRYTHDVIIGQARPLRDLRSQIWESVFTHDVRRYREYLHSKLNDIATLITGPSGSGKELVARAIALSRYIPYDASSGGFSENPNRVFFGINLSALSDTLIESELFGHKKGSFTGAFSDRDGYFASCSASGAIFLDEIGETSLSTQVKLLRVLQSRSFQRLGETQTLPFVGKIIAATNRDLEKEMTAGRFREDFYFRLCADRIQTPGLRMILQDSPEALRAMVAHFSARLGGGDEAQARLSDQVVSWVEKNLGPEYPWPGNVRELEQCFRNILIRGSYHPPKMGSGQGSGDPVLAAIEEGRAPSETVLATYVRRVHQKCGNNLTATSALLQLDRRTVRRYLALDALA